MWRNSPSPTARLRGSWLAASRLLPPSVALILVGCGPSASEDADARRVAATAQAAGIELDQCRRTIDAKRSEYDTLLAAKRYWDARLALADCPRVLNDPSLVALQSEASRLDYVASASNKKLADEQRVAAIESLQNDFPADAAKFEATRKAAQARLNRSRALNEQMAKQQRRREGVVVGMSKADVLASQWGRPQRVNTTTNAQGSREQWVYPSGGYLYFENGVLTTIQN